MLLANEEDGLQPDVHRNVAVFENGADFDGERLAAVAALVDADPGGLAFQLCAVPDHAALGAHGAARPEAGFYELVGGFLVMEVRSREDGFVIAHSTAP